MRQPSSLVTRPISVSPVADEERLRRRTVWPSFRDRPLSFITKNWRGKPLTSLETIISLIGATTTRTGLDVYARLDDGAYPKGIQVSDQQLAAVQLTGDAFHPEWNYTINPSVINA